MQAHLNSMLLKTKRAGDGGRGEGPCCAPQLGQTSPRDPRPATARRWPPDHAARIACRAAVAVGRTCRTSRCLRRTIMLCATAEPLRRAQIR